MVGRFISKSSYKPAKMRSNKEETERERKRESCKELPAKENATVRCYYLTSVQANAKFIITVKLYVEAILFKAVTVMSSLNIISVSNVWECSGPAIDNLSKTSLCSLRYHIQLWL